jgi:hypothetical protein
MSATTVFVNPDGTIIIGTPDDNLNTNNAGTISIQVIENENTQQCQYIPYGLIVCIITDTIMCVVLFAQYRFYINASILSIAISLGIIGIMKSHMIALILYGLYHFLHIAFSALTIFHIYAFLFSIYHALCLYFAIKCIKIYKFILSNNAIDSI